MNVGRFIIVIGGPTAVGKTALVEKLVQRLPNSAVINADVGQFYTPLSIGTAKPSLTAPLVDHYLFNLIDQPVDYDVAQFRRAVKHAAEEIFKQNKIPVIVGGSCFYLQSLFFPPSEALPEQKESNEQADLGNWQTLHNLDPVRAAAINPNDHYRIKRALAIWHSTGIKPSEQKPIYDPLVPAIFFWLTKERAMLYEQIHSRVIAMINDGWIEEVRNLDQKWYSFLRKKKIIGYDTIIAMLESEREDRASLIDTISQRTRKYAKRQEVFGKMLVKKIDESAKKEAGAPCFARTIDSGMIDQERVITMVLDKIMESRRIYEGE